MKMIMVREYRVYIFRREDGKTAQLGDVIEVSDANVEAYKARGFEEYSEEAASPVEPEEAPTPTPRPKKRRKKEDE